MAVLLAAVKKYESYGGDGYRFDCSEEGIV